MIFDGSNPLLRVSHHRPHPNHRRQSGSSAVRYVTAETRDVFEPQALEEMRKMCQAFEQATEPLDAERLASELHGRMWELRHEASTPRQPNWSFGLGAPFARQLARFGGPGAKGLLLALAFQAPPRLAVLCTELADELDVPTPDWAREILFAELTRAAVERCPGDGECFLLEFRRGRHLPFTVLVLISSMRGGIVRRYHLTGPFEQIAQFGDPDSHFRMGELAFSPVDRHEACRTVQLAIDRADEVDPELLDIGSAKLYRALTIGRIRPYLEAPPELSDLR